MCIRDRSGTVRYHTLKDNSLNISKLTDLKKYGMAYRRGKGKDQKWFVNPYFFVMIALEMYLGKEWKKRWGNPIMTLK